MLYIGVRFVRFTPPLFCGIWAGFAGFWGGRCLMARPRLRGSGAMGWVCVADFDRCSNRRQEWRPCRSVLTIHASENLSGVHGRVWQGSPHGQGSRLRPQKNNQQAIGR